MQQPADSKVCKVLVVDDEPPARMRLRAMLEDLDDYLWLGEAAHGEQAISLTEALQPDVILMDIRMPGIDGLQAAEKISATAHPPAVIFCTAYDEHALQAFDASAVAYLLKPIKQQQLLAALQKAAVINRAQLAALQPPVDAASDTRYLRVKTSRGEERIALNEIRALVADNKYVSAYTAGRELILDQSLRNLEAEFPDYLLRVHRNALVAIPHVLALEKISTATAPETVGQFCVVLDGASIKPAVSRRHIAQLRRLLRQG
ncbi:MAG: response regulator transcription factor [Pseudomonadales bacterium]|nr:response regulator transcription factor [Pseudomonadales bacterium]